MRVRIAAWSVLFLLSWGELAHAQDVAPSAPAAPAPSPSESIALTVPKGMPIQVVIDGDIRIKKVGQPVHGRVVEPIYAFDKLVVPVGSAVEGRIVEIEDVSRGKRTLAALDADFTPPHKIRIEFNELVLADGKHIPVQTIVTLGSGQVVKFVTAADDGARKGIKDTAAEKAKEAKEQAKQEWDNAVKQVKQPGRAHRIEKFLVAQLPAHPQYIDAGSVYFAELQEPLNFGSEPLTPQLAASLTSPPPDGSFVRARLLTGLSSSTTQKGDEVEAMLSQPLFDGDRLILPQGSILKGSVVQVQAARHMARSGQLRFIFHELVLPGGLDHKVDALLAGVESDRANNLKLDSEGGAHAAEPNSRFLKTAVTMGLATVSFGVGGDAVGDTTERAAGGGGGYKLIGIALGVAIHSQPFGMALGAAGASRSLYVHFIARGREVVFPKNTTMEIGIGVRAPTPARPIQQQ
jgi:hypothetical protein